MNMGDPPEYDEEWEREWERRRAQSRQPFRLSPRAKSVGMAAAPTESTGDARFAGYDGRMDRAARRRKSRARGEQ